MTDRIIGYFSSVSLKEEKEIKNYISTNFPFGFRIYHNINLINFPGEVIDKHNVNKFIISDSPNSDDATILLEELDFDPEDFSESSFQQQFPSRLKDRIGIVTKMLMSILHRPTVNELGVAFTFCDEIEEVKYLDSRDDLTSIIVDCEQLLHTNTLYIVKK